MPTYTLYQGNSLDILKTISARIDAVITDPPYGIKGGGGGKGSVSQERGKGYYSGVFDDSPEYISNVVVQVVRLCIQRFTSVILTPGNKNFMLYPAPDSFGCFYQPAAVGLQVFGNLDAQPIFYYGRNATRANMGKQCSFIMTSPPDESGHPCRKPTREWRQLIENHTLPGQTVLDPFMGSGVTGEICVKTGRNFIGIELDPVYFKEASERIANAAGEIVYMERETRTGQMGLFSIQ